MKYDDVMGGLFKEALSSPDPRTQNASVLLYEQHNGYTVDLRTMAVNKFPTGIVNRPERWNRPNKYAFVEHAERNSIYLAARLGIPTEGRTMVAVWASCADCARAIIQSGVKRLVRYVATEHHDHWEQSVNDADAMMSEAGVEIVEITTAFPDTPALRRGGKLWLPLGSGDCQGDV